jgi:two-component system sensor histidine kinase DesK
METSMNAINQLQRVISGPWLPPRAGKGPYLWSMFLLFFFWQYLYLRPSRRELTLATVSALLFLPLYFASFWQRNGRTLVPLTATVLLGALWAPHNVGASTFFIFAAGMCGAFDVRRTAFVLLAGVLAVPVVLTLLFDLPLNFLIPALLVGTPAGVAAILDGRLRRSREQLLRKQEEVEHLATIAERERISRDLHDVLGHTLSLITLKAELAGKLLARDPEACRREIKDIEHSARAALSEVRAAITGYRNTGLQHELASARAALLTAGVALTAQVAPVSLAPALENVLALALREAVTNIVRHAGATGCSVSLTCDTGTVLLRVDDNGRAPASVEPGNGLRGMRERVEGLGGQLLVRGGDGLLIELRLPLGAPV